MPLLCFLKKCIDRNLLLALKLIIPTLTEKVLTTTEGAKVLLGLIYKS